MLICFAALAAVSLHFWDVRAYYHNLNLSIPLFGQEQAKAPEIKSPFENSYAFIRVNSWHPEHVDRLQNSYAPFFDKVHLSMIGEGVWDPRWGGNFNYSDYATWNLTLDSDSYDRSYTFYHAMGELMQLLLDNPETQHVDGVLGFHFDAWIVPMLFADMDFERMWILNGIPKRLCMTDVEPFGIPDWSWFTVDHVHEQAKAGAQKAVEAGYVYSNPEEFCTGYV